MSEDGVIALVWRSEETRTTKNNMEVEMRDCPST